MTTTFRSPYLKRRFHDRYITFDLTASAPNTSKALGQLNAIMNQFRTNRVKSVLDFGAGNLRNTWPLIQGGFDVWISDFKEQIPEDDISLAKARKSGLQTLIYPTELLKAEIRFDAILLSYVLHILPDAKCRIEVLDACRAKLKDGGFLWVATPTFNTNARESCRPEDKYSDDWEGWVRTAPGRPLGKNLKTFYSEPSKRDLVPFISGRGFKPEFYSETTARVLRFCKA